ncbi:MULTISPECIES: tagaturonate reductase [Sporosarcina]|uniref:tagaturonate reductase n=1 Tax=Sporosarcina TaxID=1569 RepID=UPI00129A6869|nr:MULTISPECIES: tagaturonate reductase [Sporosarcina]GKV66560.1 altronate oxidoreductase [Sporosarcina sp. NCCP-2331]GLB56837.1 altronate oxidoreductase [Sporosarcina sp. NCCP-2378]
MERLNKNMAEEINSSPEKIVQFGTGNFLRGFTNWMIKRLNDETFFRGRIVSMASTSSNNYKKLEEQDNLYTLYMQGLVKGKLVEEATIIDTVSRTIPLNERYNDFLQLAAVDSVEFVFSNTTEAGIVFCDEDKLQGNIKSFPAKLTEALYKRYETFNGDKTKGWTIIPCELIENNGNVLRDFVIRYAVLWNLEESFINWIKEYNFFYNSLVDRIVPGFPTNPDEYFVKLGYRDEQLVIAEQYYIWVIEAPAALQEKLPFHSAGLNVHLVEDLTAYRESKVYYLNGAHTAMTPVALQLNESFVNQAMANPILKKYVERLFQEEITTLLKYDRNFLMEYGEEVIARFENPTIDHRLNGIALNASSKWKTRNLPMFEKYMESYEKVPLLMSLGLWSWILFYRPSSKQPIQDDSEVISKMAAFWESYERKETDANELMANIINSGLWGHYVYSAKLANQLAQWLVTFENSGFQQVVLEVINNEPSITNQ